jgi:hypothetical protein
MMGNVQDTMENVEFIEKRFSVMRNVGNTA